MANFCLTKQTKEEFKRALKSGEFNPSIYESLPDSKARRAFITKFFGEDNAVQVNSLFESKTLLKNKKAGYINAVKKVLGVKTPAGRDFISRIERMDNILNPIEEKSFLQDLADTKLGFGVTEQEARIISTLSQRMRDLKAKVNAEGKFSSKEEALRYGLTERQLEKYVNKTKLQSRSISFKEEPGKAVIDALGKTPGVLKSALSSLDNSFFGRQGIKTLLDPRTTHIWVKNFAKSFKDIGKEIIGIDATDAIKADIYSRPNSILGKYKAGRYGLDVLSEEAFPDSLPARIPLLGRLYKASEAAYNGGALRMRADLADRYIKIAEKQGLDMSNPIDARPLGELIGSLTGRGNLGKAEGLAKETNLLLFSAKFVKANFDTLFAPARYAIGKTAGITGKGAFKSKGAEFAAKEAAKNMFAVTTSIASILATAKWLDPDSVEEDPRSTNFGKVKIFGRWTDITGGMAPMVTLAMRIMPTQHNGKWGFWSKSKTGGFTDLTGGKYGQDDALDTFENFFEGKFSPALGLVRDLWKGKTYSGERVDINKPVDAAITLGKGAVVPITVQSFQSMMKDAKSSNILGSIILEGLGFSTSPQSYPKNWETSTSKELTQFKEKVGNDKFKAANEEYNIQSDAWQEKTIKESTFKNLSDEEQSNVLTQGKEKIKSKIFKKYNFKYKQQKKTSEQKRNVKKLLPK